MGMSCLAFPSIVTLGVQWGKEWICVAQEKGRKLIQACFTCGMQRVGSCVILILFEELSSLISNEQRSIDNHMVHGLGFICVWKYIPQGKAIRICVYV